MLTTLYKLDSKGKIREWNIEVYTYPSIPKYVITHGLMNGKQQEKTQEVHQGKNIGRANETTPQEQCILEAQSKWEQQKDRRGYTIEIPTEKRFGPMLAKSYAKPGTDITDLKDGKHIEFPCYYQAKLDGIRCLTSMENGSVILRSRRKKQFLAMIHIGVELDFILRDNPDVVLDGELYVHGWDFQRLTSAIKRDEPNHDSCKVQYHIYDCYDKNCLDRTFQERMVFLHGILSSVNTTVHDTIEVVFAHSIVQNEIEATLDLYTNKGYEGIMLRNKKGVYKVDGRSKDLQKCKLFIDEEFEIIGAVENVKKQGTCSFVCVTAEGYEFKCMPEGSDEQRQQYWNDWQDERIIKGDQLTCRFFSWTTSDRPVPRFPIGVSIRDYE